MAKIFAKFGTIRDLNLSDLASGEAALNILLDRIKGGLDSFTSDDLTIIKGLYKTSVGAGTFNSAANATVKITGTNGLSEPYDPLITLSNRFDRAYFTTSEPFFFGGNGLTARYFDNNQILRSGGVDAKNIFTGFDQVFDPITGRPTIDIVTGEERCAQKDNFWERGNFYYTNKIVNKLLSAYGGVEWTGYFKPRTTGEYTFRLITSGFVKFEFDTQEAPSKGFSFDPSTGTNRFDDTNFLNPSGISTRVNQTRLVDAGLPRAGSFSNGQPNPTDRGVNYGRFGAGGTAFISETTANGTGIFFDVSRDFSDDGNLVATFTISTLGSTGGKNYEVGDTFVIDGDLVGQPGQDVTITLTEVAGYFIYDDINNQVIEQIPGNSRTVNINLGNLDAFETYKIRITFFIDEDAVEKLQLDQVSGPVDKFLDCNMIFPQDTTSGIGSDLNYKYLYDEKYFDFYNIGDFKQFIDDSIKSGGTKIGTKLAIGKTTETTLEGSSGDGYSNFVNIDPIIAYYTPPIDTSVNSLLIPRTANVTVNSTIITITNTTLPDKTENIEVGNFVYGPGISIGTRVSQVVQNSGVIVDIPASTSGSNVNLSFIPHKGLVAYGENGQYSGQDGTSPTNIISDGFVFGERGVNDIQVLRGDIIVTADALHYYRNDGTKQGPFANELDLIFNANLDQSNGSLFTSANYTTTADGTGLDFFMYRNQFGALNISRVGSGSGYVNYDLFGIDGALVGQPGENVILEVQSLTDTFITGKPEFVIQPNQIFKSATIPTSQQFPYTDQFEDPETPRTKFSDDTKIIKRLYPPSDLTPLFGLENNAILWQDPMDGSNADVASLFPFQSGSSVYANDSGDPGLWFIYETFGLNNNGLAGYCQGVFDCRIEQKLTIGTQASAGAPITAGPGDAGTGYTQDVLPSLGTPSTTTTLTGVGQDMTVWFVQSGGGISYAWVADPGVGYEAGDQITIDDPVGSGSVLTVGYPDTTSNTITFRLSKSDLELNEPSTVGYFAHLFPSLDYTVNNNDINDLYGLTSIKSITPAPSEDTTFLVELEHTTGNPVQKNSISYVDSVITRITFTPPATPSPEQNKEVCFRPTDTSPPFAASSTGLTTPNEVKMVLSFTNGGEAGAGVFNPGRLIYNTLALETDRVANEININGNSDVIGGYLPITCGTTGGGEAQFYLLLTGDLEPGPVI